MPRLVWVTDPHLNFVEPEDFRAFTARIRGERPHAVLLGGDIGEASDVLQLLERLDAELQVPLYFVLGNHDYYFGSISEVRRQVAELCDRSTYLCFLTASEPVWLSDSLALIGHDGWADARLGDYERSYVMMNDYRLIRELAGVGKQQRQPLLEALGDEAAAHVRQQLEVGCQRAERLVLLTHVPPFRNACWHEGQISDNEWLPHFTCHAMGQAIVEVMANYPQNRLLVLCGHTHSPGETWPLPNVQVRTGGATYGAPEITAVLNL